MARPSQELTTTSYAVLGLLCLRPWSAYDLTQQMARSFQFFWPRAVSGIYREPQKLVGVGYATAHDVPAGPHRTKTVYAATAAGRRALRRWLKAPSAPPQFESEAIVKFFFADMGDKHDALRVLDELAAQGAALGDAFTSITASYQDSPGPFAERLHIGSLIGRFLFEYARMVQGWARWSGQHAARWPTTGPEAAALGIAIQQENAVLAGLGHPGSDPDASARETGRS